MRWIPWRQAVLAARAVTMTGLVLLDTLPLIPALWPLTAAGLAGWTLWRWRLPGGPGAPGTAGTPRPPGSSPSTDVPLDETLPWVPHAGATSAAAPALAARSGLLLGRAFRWTAHHTQTLELALVRDGALPGGRRMRAGAIPPCTPSGATASGPWCCPGASWWGMSWWPAPRARAKRAVWSCWPPRRSAPRAPWWSSIPKAIPTCWPAVLRKPTRQGRPFALFSPAFPSRCRPPLTRWTRRPRRRKWRRASRPSCPGGGEKRGDPFFTEYPLAVIERVAAAQATLGQRWTLEGSSGTGRAAAPDGSACSRPISSTSCGPGRGTGRPTSPSCTRGTISATGPPIPLPMP